MTSDGRQSVPREHATVLGVAWYWVVAIAVLVVALLVLIVVSAARASTEQATAQRAASAYTPPALPTVAPVASFSQAVDRLKDTSRPWTVAVVGDSTGYGPERWVDQFATQVSLERKRQVVLHDWNDESLQYDPAKTIGSGGAAITIWNAAAPGRGPDYSRAHLSTMIPKGITPDVIIINHGHNVGPDIAVDTNGLISALRFKYRTAPFAYTVQNPFRSDTAAEQEARASDELAYATEHGWRVIDVYDAFTSQPALAPLYEDDRHENAKGGLLWAQTVMKATGI
ncbi:SGNH/GDSL hydrolase family protein [uncultured Amnibacterium sp.]|uniref:SGNH/GDSL hydrolase family protein n=1 Tax=uncultured Amnibacterium sp. TaxID=1631851 RepID=UPI0035CB63BB